MTSITIVEDMARRAKDYKAGLVVPDYVDLFKVIPNEPPKGTRTLADIMRQRSQEVSAMMMQPWTSPPVPETTFVLTDTPNLDKTASEMLELDQLDAIPAPDIRHRKMQLD